MIQKEQIIEQLVQNKSFRDWILKKDPDLDTEWQKWAIEHPENKKLIQLAGEIVKSLSYVDEEISDNKKKHIWNQIQARTNSYPASQKRLYKDRFLNIDSSYIKACIKVVAAFAFIALSIFAFKEIGEAAKEFNPVNLSQGAGDFFKETNEGQKISISLPDGSLVILFANSKLKYSYNDELKTREVFLSGEAFFEVKKDTARAFRVFAGNAITTALGTAFLVKAKSSEMVSTVFLTEGMVFVKSTAETSTEILLNKGESAIIDKESQKIDKVSFDIEKVIAWKDGQLLFRQTPLDQVISDLEYWYGVQITFLNKPENGLTVTGKFENEYLGNVLQSLSYTVRFDYQIDDKKVLINFK
jgi:transmembrane sensor